MFVDGKRVGKYWEKTGKNSGQKDSKKSLQYFCQQKGGFIMNKYADLKKALEAYVESVKMSITDMEEEIEMVTAEMAGVKATSFEANYECLEKSFDIAKTRVSIAEMISVVSELEGLLKKFED